MSQNSNSREDHSRVITKGISNKNLAGISVKFIESQSGVDIQQNKQWAKYMLLGVDNI